MSMVFPDIRKKVLNDQPIPSGMNVLVLAPHPDDYDAIAITMKLLQQCDNRIFVRVLGTGWNRVEDEICDPATPEAKAALQRQEFHESCRRFELNEDDVAFLDMKEDSSGYIRKHPFNIELLKKAITEIKPQLIFMPHWNDTSNDRRLAATLAWDALDELGLSTPLLHFYTPKTRTMYRHFYTVFSRSEADWKAGQLQCHRSIQQHYMAHYGIGFVDKIIQLNYDAGRDIGKDKYAEVFEMKILSPLPSSRPVNMKF